MPFDDALRELTESAAKEHDPEQLREFVHAINRLLDVVERQLAKLEGRSGPLN